MSKHCTNCGAAMVQYQGMFDQAPSGPTECVKSCGAADEIQFRYRLGEHVVRDLLVDLDHDGVKTNCPDGIDRVSYVATSSPYKMAKANPGNLYRYGKRDTDNDIYYWNDGKNTWRRDKVWEIDDY